MENNNFSDFQLKQNPDFHSGHFSLSPDKIRVRCPQCFKLFSVNAKNVVESRPRFACSSCETQFWIPFPEALEQEELLGFPVSWLEEGREEDVTAHLPQASSKPISFALKDENLPILEKTETEIAPQKGEELQCPKCGHTHGLKDQECAHCGIIIAQYKESAEDIQAGFKVSRQLRESWKTLINAFDQQALHEEFIQLCRKENALDYAAYRYGRVHKACPDDEMSKTMLSKIETLLAVSASVQEEPTTKGKKKPAWYTRLSLSTIVMLLGALLIAVGYSHPTFRNVVGLGAAVFFLGIAFRIYFPKN